MRPSIEFIQDTLGENLIGAEVGVKLAEHAEEIIESLPIKHLHLIDLYVTWPQYEKVAKDRMEKYPQRVSWNIKHSFEAVKNYENEFFDFVYLDDDHGKEHVEEELDLWYPKIKPGGVLCGHDYRDPSWVKIAVDSWGIKNKYFISSGNDDWWFVKGKDKK